MAEQRSFVFALVFITLFSVMVATIPTGLQGEGDNPDMVTPLDPNIISGYSDGETFSNSNFSAGVYEYELNSRTWLCLTDDLSFELYAKILIAGFLWIGGLDVVKFVSDSGTDRGTTLTLLEIDLDDTDGTARYALQYEASGGAAGDLICYWNTTAYDNSTEAWDDNGLYLFHAVGFDTTATADIGALLLSLLFLQLPDVPLLVNILIATPIWASVVYLIWWVLKETIPFI